MTTDASRMPTALSSVAGAVGARSGGLRLVYLWWILLILEPDWFLATLTGVPFYRLPTLLAPVLLVVLARAGNSRALYPPWLAFMALHVVAAVLAENRGYAVIASKSLILIYLACAGVLAYVDSPARARPVFRIYLLGFIWYGLQGLRLGLVEWHPLLSNEDSYGPLMCMGLGFAYFFALSESSRIWKLLGYATVALSMVGVVASFARGAVLSTLLVMFVVWLRSPRKWVALLGAAAAGGIGLLAVDVLFPGGEFWAEMQTISEGTEDGTGQTRWVMWQMAIDVWLRSPVFGVGAENFGVIASEIVPDDPTRGALEVSSRLYNAALHNVYVQILCEEGIVGSLLFLGMTADFARRVWRLCLPACAAEWKRQGGTSDLRCLALGLEAAMVGFLANAFFYNQLYIHWFWTILTLGLVLSHIATPPALDRVDASGAAAEVAAERGGQA